MTQLANLITSEAAALKLKVSVSYVHELVRKGRLNWVGENRLNAGEVEQLAQLMDKLRQGGIATLVDIAGSDLSQL